MKLTDPRVLTALILGMLFTGVFAFAVYTASLDDSVFQAPTIKADTFYVGGQTLAQYITATAPGSTVTAQASAYTWIVSKVGSNYIANSTIGAASVTSTSSSTVFNALSGGIYVKAGTYTVDANIDLDVAYTVVEGEGWGTLFTLANNVDDNVFKLTAGNIFLRNFRIYGNNANNAGTSHGIYSYRSNGHRIENLKIYDCESDGIHVGESTWENGSLGGKISGCYIGSSVDPNLGNGIYLDYSATDWEVDNNVLAKHTGVGMAGLVIDGSNELTSKNHMWGNYYNVFVAPANHVSGWVSVGDKFMDNIREAIHKPTGKWWKNSVISGGYFWRNGEVSAGAPTTGTYDSIVTAGDVRCINIVGCNMRGENDDPLHITKYFWNANSSVDYCMVTGSIVEGYTQADPIVFAGTGCSEANNIEYDNS